MIRKAAGKLKAAVPSGQTEDIVAFLAGELSGSATAASKTEDQSPGAKSVQLWMNQESSQAVERWARTNNSSNVAQHPSYTSVLASVCKKLKLDAPVDEDTSVSLTLADCLWTCAEAIFDHVPASVPSLAAAVVAKVGAGAEGKGCVDVKALLPEHVHFLCSKTDLLDTNEDALAAYRFCGFVALCRVVCTCIACFIMNWGATATALTCTALHLLDSCS